jgi:hypothetical protein
MTVALPAYISVVFLITVFVTAGLFIHLVRKAGDDKPAVRVLTYLIPLWMILHGFNALAGYYAPDPASIPLMMLTGPLPALLFLGTFFLLFRERVIAYLPIKLLTIIHIVRIPVEFVLHWLYEYGAVPAVMTYSGANFDILSGITAPIVYYFAFRNRQPNRTLLAVWNVLALGLVITIVTIAVLSFPAPFQQLAFDQPNLAVVYFPFVWLPTVVVPIVLFSHAASLYKIWANKLN